VINIVKGVDQFLDEVVQCKKIFSSSLHGIIGAHSMKTPVTWVKFSNGILGDGTKYLDYYQSLGVQSPEFMDLRKASSREIAKKFYLHEPTEVSIPEEMIDSLLEVCPFRRT